MTLIVIPVRLESIRVERKPLRMVGEQPFICRVLEYVKALEIPDAEVVVAADNVAISNAVWDVHPTTTVVLTGKHRNGTERTAEVVLQLKHSMDSHEIVVNIQGDQLITDPLTITRPIASVAVYGYDIGTVRTAASIEDMTNPDRVKVMTAEWERVWGFYRLAAWGPLQTSGPRYGLAVHVGVYACTVETLLRWANFHPTPIEEALGLEQVRAIENDLSMVAPLVSRPLVVDNDTDLFAARTAVGIRAASLTKDKARVPK